MPVGAGRLSGGVGRREPVTLRISLLMSLLMREMWLLLHHTGLYTVMGFKILRTGSLSNCRLLTINRFPSFYSKGLMSITKSKKGFADYPGIPRTGSHEPVRTP